MTKITTTINKHSSKRRECLGGGLVLLAMTTLSACGWRIRGKVDLPYKNHIQNFFFFFVLYDR